MNMGSTPASTSRRTLVAGVAWSVPAVAGAAAAPAVAASSSCAPTRQMVFGNMGTQDASGVVPPNLLSMSVVHNWGELGKAVTDPATGIVWQVSYTTMTFTNTSAFTITDLVYPQPYMGVAVGAQTDYAGGTWSTSEGLWWWNDPTTGYENPNEPHAGVYIVTMRVAPTDPADPTTASAMQTLGSWSQFSPYVASTFVWPKYKPRSVTDSDNIPVYNLSSSSLAPGESATVSYTVWREKGSSAYYGFGAPDIVVGTVQCP